MAQLIHLLRHGSTDENLQGKFIGSSDVPISEIGKEEVGKLSSAISEMNPNRVLCSPLKRCRQTYESLNDEGCDLPPCEMESDLREIDFGSWEGLSFKEIASAFPEQTKSWSTFDKNFSFPAGEGLESFLNRMDKLSGQLAEMEDEVCLLITHGGVIRHLLCRWLGLDPRQYLLFHAAPASLTSVEIFKDKGVLLQLNWKPDALL